MVGQFRRFFRDDSGATAIEYGLLAALISVVLIGSFTFLGNNITTLFGSTQNGAGGVIQHAADSLK